MGMVYRAKDTILQRLVALKLLRYNGSDSNRTRDRFLREARAMAALQNDHIVTVFQVGELERPDSVPISFLAMELLHGESLFDWMKRTPRPSVASIVRIGRQAAAGLAAAHAQNLIHRDVKPANLFLEIPASWRSQPDGQRPSLGEIARVKLLDFGLAQSVEGEGVRPEESLFGTPGYMAPEQVRGEPIDGRCDLYGLGCVLYELCTGAHPFPNRIRHKRKAATSEALAPIRDRNPDVPPPVAMLVERMLADVPADRPSSARSVEKELAVFEADFAPTDTKTARAAATIVDPIGMPITRKDRRWAATLTALFVALAALGILLVRLLNSQFDSAMAKNGPNDESSRRQAASAASTRGVENDARMNSWSKGPPDAEWCRRIGELPPDEQAFYVLRKLKELNPGYNGQAQHVGTESGDVAVFSIHTDNVSDIRPVKALRGLLTFIAVGSKLIGAGKLRDISPLEGLDLRQLFVNGNPDLEDFSAVKGMKNLVQLEAGETKIRSVEGLPPSLKILVVSRSAVRDLTPLRNLSNLNNFNCLGCPTHSLEPLSELPLKILHCNYQPERDEAVVRRMTNLTTVNNLPIQKLPRSVPKSPSDD
jgi:serine/threonine protein kinase